jgi:hypothetical protein
MDHVTLEYLRLAGWVMAWAVVAGALAYGGYMAFSWFRSSTGKLGAPKRDMRMLWKVVKLGEPVVEGFGLPEKIQFGVIISTDEMLAQTQTLLICPLINAVDTATGQAMAIMPWHVPVEISQDPTRLNGEVEFGRKYVSTKIVLPVGAGEIDPDGLERGYLSEASRAEVSKKLSLWLPPFARMTHHF